MYSFVKLNFSESDKKITFILLFILLFVILIVGYLQKLIGKIMRRQGLLVDTMMYDILKTKTIDDKKVFRKEAYRKSNVYFTKKAYIPFLCLFVSIMAILIYGFATNDNGISYYGNGLHDLCFIFDWPTTKFFNIEIISNWPTLAQYPDYSWEFSKYYAAFFTIIYLISGGFFAYQVQAYLSRCLRIRQLSKHYFTKELTNQTTNTQI